jgi:hypothetical protein
MPSNRFAFLRDAVRNHPVVVATTAATAGVLLGGFVVVQVFAPPKPHVEMAGTAQAAATVKAEPKTSAETTGSAPSGETVASKECDQQAWPHLTGACMEEYRNKNRSPRVVSTDKLEKPTVEVSPPASEESRLAAPAAWAPSVAFPAPLAAPPPVTTASAPPQAADPVLSKPAVPVPSPPVVVATPAPVAAPAEAPAQAAAVNAEPKEKHAAKKSKRKPKAPAKQNLGDDEDSTVANNNDDRTDRRPDRSRRVVERWTERDYDVPDSRGGGRRQVTVIRRGGGGLFENLFGMGRGGDDD